MWFTKGRERFLPDKIHKFLRICCFPAFLKWKGFHSNWFAVDSWKHVAFKGRTIIPCQKKPQRKDLCQIIMPFAANLLEL